MIRRRERKTCFHGEHENTQSYLVSRGRRGGWWRSVMDNDPFSPPLRTPFAFDEVQQQSYKLDKYRLNSSPDARLFSETISLYYIYYFIGAIEEKTRIARSADCETFNVDHIFISCEIGIEHSVSLRGLGWCGRDGKSLQTHSFAHK